MERRHFLRACGCSGVVAAGARLLGAGWDPPARLQHPELGTDEGGLWALLDRQEERLRHSSFLIRDKDLNDYVHGIACRLAQAHCPDIRSYLVRSPYFNANMAANGMMQVWSGLLLRTQNEAQLAAVIGHEIGHYLARHSLQGLRDAKSRSAAANFLLLIPVAGPLAAIGTMAGAFAYSREHERAADQIGLELMAAAGYPPMEASKVWTHLLEELAAEKDWSGDPGKRSFLFATHPTEKERQSTLEARARALGKADLDPGVHPLRKAIAPHRFAWLEDELKRRRYGRASPSSIVCARMTPWMAKPPISAASSSACATRPETRTGPWSPAKKPQNCPVRPLRCIGPWACCTRKRGASPRCGPPTAATSRPSPWRRMRR